MDSTATIALVLTAKDMASKEINRVNSSLKGLKSGALSGLPIGFMGLAGAATAATAALVNGVQGAIEEEAQLRKLDTVLQANVPNWDAYTTAIDQATSSAQDHAFTDDQVRESLTKLLPVTKDVNKALALQQTAMDLARLKGIDLAEASQALVDIEGGRYRALGKLIGSTKEITSETEALAAVQKAAAGQADAYMTTTAGKAEALKNNFDELTEAVAGALVPAISDFSAVLLNAGDALDAVNGGGREAEDGLVAFTDAAIGFMGLNPLWEKNLPALNAQLAKEREAADKATAAWDTHSEATATAREQLKLTNKALGITAGEADDAAGSISNLAKAFGGLVPDRWAFSVSFDRSAGKRQQQQNENKPKKPKKKTADGGWVGWDGPETILAGERGPEYVVPAHAIRQSAPQPAGVAIQGVSERELMDMVDRQLYFKLRRAGTAS